MENMVEVDQPVLTAARQGDAYREAILRDQPRQQLERVPSYLIGDLERASLPLLH